MKKLELHLYIDSYQNVGELPAEEKKLLNAAAEIVKKAYAPYSHFSVGAAVLLENGEIIAGNNQENAAYPSGLCAERVALFYAASQFPDQKIKAIAISALHPNKSGATRLSPCGACRQALAEYEIKFGSPIKIVFPWDLGKVYVCDSVHTLLPLMFNQHHLE